MHRWGDDARDAGIAALTQLIIRLVWTVLSRLLSRRSTKDTEEEEE
jgi:hypothetical protein